MISRSGEQKDREVLETSFARLMQMYMFVIEVCRSQNIITHTFPGTRQFFPFECTTALWSGKESVVLTTDKGTFGQSQSKMTAVSDVYQSKPV